MSKSTLTRRNLVAGAAAVPAFALPAVAGTAATPSPDELAALEERQSLPVPNKWLRCCAPATS
jgi:hypothetical protein